MNRERWRRLKTLFRRALDQPAAGRSAFVADVAEQEPELADHLEALLDRHRDTDDGSIAIIPIDPPAAAPGRRIGPYRLLDELGRGGMGTVYLAERDDGAFAQRVAVKVLTAPGNPRSLIERFAQERQILADLSHPGIASLLDGGTTEDGLAYLVVEAIDGVPISRYCRQLQLTVEERIRLFLQVCEAVCFAHANLVIHRDLKPGNILVTADGRAKLLDFGIAKLTHPQLSAGVVTAAAERLATPRYASPEQLRGDPVTTATDVYSLGVVLFELLVERPPLDLDGCSPAEAERVVSDVAPPLPSEAVGRDATSSSRRRLARRLAGDLDTIVATALAKQPSRRYPSVESLAEDLRRYLDGRPVLARRPTLAYRSSRFLRRHWKAALAAAGAWILLAATATTALVQSQRARAERADADAARVTAEVHAAEEAAERRRAERVTSLLADLIEAADPERSRGDELTVREVIARGAEGVRKELANDPRQRAAMLAALGEACERLGAHDQAAQLLGEALELQLRHLGDGHREVVRTLTRLGRVHYQTRRLTDAEQCFERALQSAEQTGLATVDDDHVAARYGLALVRFTEGNYDEAESLLRRVLTEQNQLYGEDHPAVAETLNELGELRLERADYDEAEALLRRALAIRRRLFGDRHREVAVNQIDLARVLAARASLTEAEALYRQAFEIQTEVLGPQHRQLAYTVNGLGGILHQQGRFEAAAERLREALERLRAAPEISPVEEAGMMNDLALAYHSANEFGRAIPLLRIASERFREELGAEHPWTATVQHNLARSLYRDGQVAAAEILFRQAIERRRKALGAEHPQVADSLASLGQVMLDRGAIDEAQPLIEESLVIRRTHFPAGHALIAEAESLLGATMTAAARYEEAEALLLRAYADLDGSVVRLDHGPERVLRQLVELYERWGDADQAERYRQLIPSPVPPSKSAATSPAQPSTRP